VQPHEARLVYTEFLAQAVTAREVWSLGCNGELVVVTGADVGCFPLWPDLASAEYFQARNWPKLQPAKVTLRLLIRVVLRALAEQRIPVGVGVAPHPDAVFVDAERVRRDLLAAKQALRASRSHGRCQRG
jgi:hypothetical protein